MFIAISPSTLDVNFIGNDLRSFTHQMGFSSILMLPELCQRDSKHLHMVSAAGGPKVR
jgi:hypothetical protein